MGTGVKVPATKVGTFDASRIERRAAHVGGISTVPARGERLEVSPTNPGSWGGRHTGPNRVGRTDGDIASGVLPSCGESFTNHNACVKVRLFGVACRHDGLEPHAPAEDDPLRSAPAPSVGVFTGRLNNVVVGRDT